jgi:hypothetical protein
MRRANDRNSVKLYNSLGNNSTNEQVFILSETNESYYSKTERNGDWDREESRTSHEQVKMRRYCNNREWRVRNSK